MARFGESPQHSVGVEEEFFLVDPDTRDLVPCIEDILEATPEARDGNVQAEFYQSVVEAATDVCADLTELGAEVRDLRRLLVELAADAGAEPAAAGTHPTARWQDAVVTEKSRYEETVDLVGWPALWELVCGLHVHVGVPTREDALFVHNRLRAYLPHLLLLSTNSPFWAGEATGYMSSRLPIWDGMPRAGLPRAFDDWTDFQGTVDALREAGAIEDVTRLWWDVRPRPDLGTVEVRIPDMPTTVEDALALAGLTRALVARLCEARGEGEELPPLPRHEVIDENRDRAQHRGPRTRLLRPTGDGMTTEPAPAAVERLVAWLGDVPREVGATDAVARAQAIAEEEATGADRQLAVHEREGSLAAVVDDVVRRTRPGKA